MTLSPGEIARRKAEAVGRPEDWEEFLPSSTSTPQKSEPQESTTIPSQLAAEIPNTAILFYCFAVLSLIGGISMAYNFLPSEEVQKAFGRASSYQLSIIVFTLGILEAGIFTAIAKVLIYLKQIEANTRAMKVNSTNA